MPAILVELGKLSPYIVLPVLFIYVMWKIYNSNSDFIKELLKEKSEQINSLIQQFSVINDNLNKTIKEIESNNSAQSKCQDITNNELQKLNDKIDGMRFDIATTYNLQNIASRMKKE